MIPRRLACHTRLQHAPAGRRLAPGSILPVFAYAAGQYALASRRPGAVLQTSGYATGHCRAPALWLSITRAHVPDSIDEEAQVV